MSNDTVRTTQVTTTPAPKASIGKLQINLTSIAGYQPIKNARVTISFTGDPNATQQDVTTDAQGQTPEIDLPAPSLEYSMTPNPEQPYAEYTIQIDTPGYESVYISGAQILPEVTALQNVTLIPQPEETEEQRTYVIPPHTLFGDYPPKIAESAIKSTEETGEIVLNRVVIPEFIVVHDGPPSDNSAQNYYVRYKDYIKNVASSEIYATWPEETIIANVLAIQSFTLNRVYTEWYRNR